MVVLSTRERGKVGIHSLFRDTSSIQSNRGHTDTFGIFCQTIRGAGASYCTEAGLFVFLPFRVFVFLPFLFYRLCVFFSSFVFLFSFFLCSLSCLYVSSPRGGGASNSARRLGLSRSKFSLQLAQSSAKSCHQLATILSIF